MNLETRFGFELPEWLAAELPGGKHERSPKSVAREIKGDAAQARFVCELAERNVLENSGGPFGAAVFSTESGALLSVGVNLVPGLQVSSLHAEIVALTLAQCALGKARLMEHGKCTLVTSTEPCAMCLGAIPWAAPAKLVCAGDERAARAIGFDEGDKPENWVARLEARGIEVRRQVATSEAARVLARYAELERQLY